MRNGNCAYRSVGAARGRQGGVNIHTLASLPNFFFVLLVIGSAAGIVGERWLCFFFSGAEDAWGVSRRPLLRN